MDFGSENLVLLFLPLTVFYHVVYVGIWKVNWSMIHSLIRWNLESLLVFAYDHLFEMYIDLLFDKQFPFSRNFTPFSLCCDTNYGEPLRIFGFSVTAF